MYTLKLMFMSGVDDGLNLTLSSQAGNGRAINNGWEFRLGRADTCDVNILYDTQVSREHAALRVLAEGIWLVDLESKNGCYVDEHKVDEPTLLEEGTMFRLGMTRFRLEEIVE